jgi:hypothetical protein
MDADLSRRKFHPATLALLERLQGKRAPVEVNVPKESPPACKACEGTGKDSRGNVCWACLQHGRVS